MRIWLVMVGLAAVGCGRAGERVVLYSAQDPPFAQAVLAGFAKPGLSVVVRYDSEANKSVGLFRELQQEASRPRCDVHWNNEILTTLMLAKAGIYEAYASPNGTPFPPAMKAADRTWHGFAARARVLLVNTDLLGPDPMPRRLLDLADPKWQDKLGIAKPSHGTTATQAACLFEVLGPDSAKRFYRGLKANGVKVYAGNKHVAEAVGRGEIAVGLTDTDDAMGEVNAGRPVRVIFPDSDGGTAEHPRLGTLFIPNTVAVIKGCPNPKGARELVDFLLSPDVEKKLALGGGYQIPLNPNVKVELPAAIESARAAKPMAVDFAKAAELWEEMQEFVRNEFAR